MLKTAMEAKDAKVSKKLKMIDLQLKKMKIDKDTGNNDDDDNSSEFDRADLLKHIKGAIVSDNSDK
jgi:hypothetical protein